MKFFPFLLLIFPLAAKPLEIPAHSAYVSPDPDAAVVRENQPIREWNDATQSISWYGIIKHPGDLDAAVEVTLPKGRDVLLAMTVEGKNRVAMVKGNDAVQVVRFGSFAVGEKGYKEFRLRAKGSKPLGDIGKLILDGPATREAHFNLKERRNSASVHLSYPQPKGVDVAGFYCEAIGIEDPLATYYMTCGWHRGYFGMQVNGPNERRIIFSVWDSGGEPVSRDKVAAEDRVTLIGKGEGVHSGDFGNEGTGGHSHLKYMWKTGSLQRFYVTAKPVDETHTIYTGYWFHPDTSKWMLISSWRAPKEGKYMHGLYSFSENFGGASGHLVRKANFGNQWIVDKDGKWIEVTEASFSHDETGKTDRLDRFMGVENGMFFLNQGGFTDDFTPYGKKFTLPNGKAPVDMELPVVRE